ncbi:MAG TPA: ATP-binding cassette domain-containing protein [Firmicutes bacterium]|nr:energy-coupling factor transport system ATP-binding protein [Bacillota bacterium]HHV56581.1 ATP-binding cassette domain-containing protein [Bacillota bacterium]
MREVLVNMQGVTFTYEGSSDPALKNVDFTLHKGEFVLLTGPGGAGKTTLCSCLNGLIPNFFMGRFSGKVEVCGLDTKKVSIGQLSQKVGLIFQDPLSQLVCNTVIDEVAFGPENLGVPSAEIEQRIRQAIEAVRLKGLEDKQPTGLSGGQQQAVALAAILAMLPEVFVLDEPTANIDPLGSRQVFSLVRELARQGKTVLLVSHKIEDLVDLVDRMVVMDQGKIIAQGPPRQVLQDTRRLKELGLAPPQVAELALELRKAGLVKDGFYPITVEEALAGLQPLASVRSPLPSPKSAPANEPRATGTRDGAPPAIEVRDLHFQYPGNGSDALNGINLTIERGEFVGIIGQNGSGKSTLVKHFDGLLMPCSGSVKIFGQETRAMSPKTLVSKVGYVFQNPDLQLFKSVVREELAFGLRNIGLGEAEINRRIAEAAQVMGITDVLDRNPDSLDKGRRQRVAVASVLAMGSDILVVDEPTTGQDPKRAREVMEEARRFNALGKTVIVISHDMKLIAEFVHRVVIMKAGRILFDGNVREAFAQEDILTDTCLDSPQITQLGIKLGAGVVLTVQELAAYLQNKGGEIDGPDRDRLSAR